MPATLIDETQTQPNPLRPGPEWTSFEQFRIAGPGGVEAVNTGQVGTLRTKSSVFRVLREEDFQVLLGLASEVARLKGGLATLIHAARVVRDHPTSPSAVDLLVHLAAQYGSGPAIQTQPIELETTPSIEDDEVIIDPAELKRRVTKR